LAVLWRRSHREGKQGRIGWSAQLLERQLVSYI
jgi:hypothetical protein